MPKNKSNNKGALLAVVLVGASVVAGLAAYVKYTPADKVPADQHKDHIQAPQRHHEPEVQVSQRPEKTSTKATVLTPYYEGDNLKFRHLDVPVPNGQDAPVYVVNSFLRESKVYGSDVRLLSIDIRDGVAHLYFNEGFSGTQGTEDEQTVIQGISASLAQFPEIKKALFYANGEQVKSIGSIDLTEPLDVR
ncbi:MAG TPA: GerMN domain-containing protein [Fimbriimonadaceae bacterium]|nr:GerMN domain-containing protein [Fimbriimonadaceae bacterium]